MVKKGIVKFSKIVATFTMVLAVVSVNATCFFFSHQPDIYSNKNVININNNEDEDIKKINDWINGTVLAQSKPF